MFLVSVKGQTLIGEIIVTKSLRIADLEFLIDGLRYYETTHCDGPRAALDDGTFIQGKKVSGQLQIRVRTLSEPFVAELSEVKEIRRLRKSVG